MESKDSDQSLVKKCFEFCSTLTDKGCKYSFSLKLGQSFNFSLTSEQGAPPKAKTKRSQSYLRRQQRRREDFLRKRSGFSPEKVVAVPAPRQDAAEKAAGHHQEEEAVVDTNTLRTDFLPVPAGVTQGHSKEEPVGEVTRSPPHLDLCPKPKFPRQSEGSVDSSATEDDADQQSTAVVSTESPSIRLFHPEKEEEVLQAGSVDKEEPDKGAEWARVARRRQIPDARPVNLSPNSAGATRQAGVPVIADKKHQRSQWSPKRRSDFRDHWVTRQIRGTPDSVLVRAPPDAAFADIERAVLKFDFTKIKKIPGIMNGYEFNNEGHF